MWTVLCVRRYGGEDCVWEKGEGFVADTLEERKGYIYGYDIEGFPYSFPIEHFQYSRYQEYPTYKGNTYPRVYA